MISLKDQKLLVITPHPDDEVLGCGGLISRIKSEGGKVYILFLTAGVTFDYSEQGISTGQERVREVENVAKFLKYDDYRIVFPGDDYHLRLDKIPKKDMMHEIENGEKISLNTIKPTIVATPHLSDYNQDHRAATEAVFAATRPAPEETKPFQRIILGYESVPTASWWDTTTGRPNFFVELTDKELSAKLAALKLYKSQVRTGNHPRSLHAIRNLSYYRGMTIGNKAAEAFFSYRLLV